jgi:hypothetical protein
LLAQNYSIEHTLKPSSSKSLDEAQINLLLSSDEYIKSLRPGTEKEITQT